MEKTEEGIQGKNVLSTTTVKSTNEDVKNFILQAKKALEKGKSKKARRFLLKAERKLSIKNDKALENHPELIEKATEAIPAKNGNLSQKMKKLSEC